MNPTPVTSHPSSEQAELQAAVAGRYSIEREIGRGGMGVVFLARDVALERPVAIKLLPRHLAHHAGVRERFLREARTAAQLMHPNVVPIHAVEESDGLSFIVMALVDGETVTERVARIGVLAPDSALRLMQEVAWALGYAHTRGVVHRDIKPDNILLEHASGRAIVTDFGIARVSTEETLSAEGAFVGTVRYMSPEQAGGEPVDGRSDLYSLGATTYFALTGRSPVDGPTLPAMLTQLMTEPTVPLATLRPEVPSALAAIVMRTLAKDPRDRFADADALAAAMRDTVAPERAVRPEVRAFLREAHAGSVMFVLAILAMAFAIIGMAAGVFARINAVPIAVGTAGIGMLLLWSIAMLSGVLDLRSARIPLAQVIDAITADVNEVAALRHKRRVKETSVRRLIAGLGVAMLTIGTAIMIPLIGRPLDAWRDVPWWFIPAGALYVWVGLSKRIKGEWLVGDSQLRAKGDISLMRGLLRLRPVAWWYTRGLRTAARAPVTTAPTATLLLQRVDELIRELPADMRDRLGDLLPAAAGLERAIGALRARITQLDRALVEIPEASAARREFVQARVRASERLAEGIAGLEQMRTDLLRLGAGLVAADGITAELEKARELSEAIDAELHGREVVERIVRQ